MSSKHENSTAFLDLLFLLVLGFVMLFIIAFLLIAEQNNKQNDIIKKAEFIVTVTWNNETSDDVDLWMRSPSNDVINYQSKQHGLFHLERDDLGTLNDTYISKSTGSILVPINKETITIRGIVPGEYVVNTHLYAHRSGNPVNVIVEIIKINPYIIVDTVALDLVQPKQEITASIFYIDEKGNFMMISRDQVPIANKANLQ